jgi:hypothetical protein
MKVPISLLTLIVLTSLEAQAGDDQSALHPVQPGHILPIVTTTTGNWVNTNVVPATNWPAKNMPATTNGPATNRPSTLKPPTGFHVQVGNELP